MGDDDTTNNKRGKVVRHGDGCSLGRNSYFVLVGGEARQSHGSPNHNEREFLHTSVPFVGQAYQSLREAGIPRDRIITICQLQDYRSTLQFGAGGRLQERRTGSIETRFYRKQLNETDELCRLLLEEGGADYDKESVNPATIHGDSHPATRNNNATTSAENEQNDNHYMTAEWFAHFPYPSPRNDIYDFVATEGAARGEAPYYLYSTQLRLLFHKLFSENGSRPIVGLLNYCTSGGNLEFMRRSPLVQRSLGVNQWPLFLMSSSGKSANSLVSGLWHQVFQILSSCLVMGGGGSQKQQQHTMETLFDAAACGYYKENMYDLLNECKERAFSEPIWRLDFRQLIGRESTVDHSTAIAGCDPWHLDLRDCLLGQDGKPNVCALRELQNAYSNGKAFRIVEKKTMEKYAELSDVVWADLAAEPDLVVVWARDHDNNNNNKQRLLWRDIPNSKPFCCPITGWQGENMNLKVDLAKEVMVAFNRKIARPEFVCGDNSFFREAKVYDIFAA